MKKSEIRAVLQGFGFFRFSAARNGRVQWYDRFVRQHNGGGSPLYLLGIAVNDTAQAEAVVQTF